MIKNYILNLKFVKEKINETKKYYEKILIETKKKYNESLNKDENNNEKTIKTNTITDVNTDEYRNIISNLKQEITQKNLTIEQLKNINYEKNQTINKLKHYT